MEEHLQEKTDSFDVSDILTTLCSDYVAVYRVDFSTGKFDIYKLTERLRGDVKSVVRQNNSYAQTMERYISMFVEDKEQEYVRKMAEPEHILEELKTRKNYFIRYRVKENAQGNEYFEMQFADTGRTEGERIVIVGIRNVDYIVQKEKAYKQKTQQDIEETLEGARTGIWSIEDEDGCEPRMYGDKTMQMLLGTDRELSPEKRYQYWYERIDPEYVDMVQESVNEMLQDQRSEVIYPWNHPTLGKIYVRCGGIRDAKYEKKGYRLKGYHQDITETTVAKQKQEKALMEALVEAKRANQAKTEFLSHMSHDIRTPINGILGMLEICEKSPDDPVRQKECRDKIRTSAQHLLSLINDVLDISKLESGNFNFAEEPFDLRDVLDSCMEILGSQAEEQGIVMELKCGELPHTGLIGSPLHIRQILINIIGNAVKYNRPYGRVTVYAGELPEENGTTVCRFVVEDNGIGMSEEFQERLFEPFTQENGDARTSYKGTGLGMAITKNLVEQMGGTISVESELGKGSVFTVELPLRIAEAPKTGPEEKKKNTNAVISGMRVLLVEDNDINREIAQYLLKDAGAIVMEARNGKAAVDAFAASAPGEIDCILMDVMMPVMDGLEATRVIRGLDHPDAATVPIIALSANAFAEDAQKAKEAGMNEHLAKPLDTKKMFETIASYRRRK